MLQVECPWCGIRDEVEFSFGGESHIVRPAADVTDAQWADYLFNRANPKGIYYERLCHSYGCQRWFNIARHTVTHEIVAVYTFDQRRPEADEATGR